jgi:hypothetical protein
MAKDGLTAALTMTDRPWGERSKRSFYRFKKSVAGSRVKLQ